MKKNFFAINAKVKARRANLLSARDFWDLCALVDTRVIDTGVNDTSVNEKNETAAFLPFLPKYARDFVISLDFERPAAACFFKNINALDKSSRESLRRVFGAEADLRNILWLYRLKKFHGIHGDAVFSFLSPQGFRLNAAEISRLAHANDFAQEVKKGAYGGVFKSPVDFSEQAVSRAIRAEFKREYRHGNLAVLCGYLHARFLQKKNLAAIAHGAARGLSAEEIFARLHL